MILVFGSTGQVASELRGCLPDGRFLSRADADLRDPASLALAIESIRPDAVINAAAYTAVDRAEDDRDLAAAVNASAPAAMGRACAALGIPLVHLSTDYVFGGQGTSPHRVRDPIGPLNVYGQTKAAGEQAIRDSGATHAILRTSWVFSRHGNNFVKSMVALSQKRDELRIVEDQVGGPTPAGAIAQACVTIARALQSQPHLSGTYHFSGAPDVSWADFARAIFAESGEETTVIGIPTREYPTPAKRPLNSRLDCSDLANFGLDRPDWRATLPSILNSLDHT